MGLNDMDVHDKNIVIQKCVDKQNIIVGDCLNYAITVINEGDILINKITIIDTLVSELEFISGSVVLGNLPLPDESVLSGVEIGSLKPNEIKTINFKAKVISRPNNGIIENSAIAKFCYDVHLDNTLRVMDKTSNIASIKVDIADLNIIKDADKKIASRGDTVTYNVEIINTGTIAARNILFKDKLPKEVSLIKNSFEVNGKVINTIGDDIDIYVGSINPNDSIFISYSVIVNSSNCSGLLINKASAKFGYNLCKAKFGEKVCSCDDINNSEIKLGLSTFKQISIDDNLCIPEVKPDIEEINDMNVEVKILSHHVIRTPSIISNEGQKLSGYKLIVRGVLKELLEYTSDTLEQSVHSAYFSVPFSTFIVLPEDFKIGSKVEVEFDIEDIYFKKINKRCFFKNITLLLNAKIMYC